MLRRYRQYRIAKQKLADEAREMLAEGRGHELRWEHELAAEWSDWFLGYQRQAYHRCGEKV